VEKEEIRCAWCGHIIHDVEKTRTDYLNGERFLYHYNKAYDCLEISKSVRKKKEVSRL